MLLRQQLKCLLAAAALMSPMSAQHPANVLILPYGATCDFFGQPSTISGSYNAVRGQLDIGVAGSQTCCNTFLSQQFLMIGVRPIQPGLPLPGVLLPTCELALMPIIAIPSAMRGAWRLRLPPLMLGQQFYFQGFNDYLTTIGLSHDFQTSDALELTII